MPISVRQCLLSACLLAAGACSPVLNWREVRPEGSAAALLFPCKPSSESRHLMLAGTPVMLTLHSCATAGATYALGFAEFEDPARVSPALAQLQDAAKRNLGGSARMLPMPSIPGMTPNLQSQRLVVEGRLPDGTAIWQQMAVFSRGKRVYQASMIGTSHDAEAVNTFFGSIRLAD